MKGLEIAKGYFEEYGRPVLEEQFPQFLPFLAAGVSGSGSECFGYDDEVSKDHDFSPLFCLFLPGEDIVDRRTAFALERALAKLPGEYRGVKRPRIAPTGGSRRGVIRTGDFFTEKTGTPDGVLTAAQWLSIPEYYLAEAVNGEIYFDSYGEVTAIRERLKAYPADIMKKKLAGHLLLMGQAGQYNYSRCLAHGEMAAAQLAAVEFVRHAMSAVFLLNGVYQPFYKWSFRALRQLETLSIEAELMEYLISSGNEEEQAAEKEKVIEGICADIIDELQARELTKAVCLDAEKHAYSVNDSIGDPSIRNMHILEGVRDF